MRVSFLSLVFLTTFLCAEPPREVPSNLKDQFTLGGKVPLLSWYRNDSYPPSTPLFYSKAEIDQNIEKTRKKEVSYYGMTDKWLYAALEKHSIKGKTVAIIGSTRPWYESVVVAYGGIPTTIEYNTISTDDPRLTLLTVDAFTANPVTFDVILSISSIEHDGLGRYGDPINPNGDLEFMAKVKSMLNQDGHMILAMPVGRDALVWNVHRIYGQLRLPLLLKNWNVIDTFGFSKNHFFDRLGNGGYQPIFYLSPK